MSWPRIDEATTDQLEWWSEQILNADSLELVFTFTPSSTPPYSPNCAA
jgi:hypothetical protein